MYQGFFMVRREVFRQTETGRMTGTEYMAYTALIGVADPETGVWIGSAGKLAGVFGRTVSERSMREALMGLEKNPHVRYIRRFIKRGSHSNYPILIHGFDITVGVLKGMRVNADATTDFEHIVYYDPRSDRAEGGKDSAQ